MSDEKITQLTADTAPTTDDLAVIVNDPAGTPGTKKVTLSNLFTVIWAAVTNAATAKTTPADGDLFSIVDSAASNVIKKITFANVKAEVLATVTSGTWTPTLTNVTNVSSSTASVGQYLRIGNVVTCSVYFDADPVTTGTTQVDLTLPIASNFSSGIQCLGAGMTNGGSYDEPILVIGTGTDDRVRCLWKAIGTISVGRAVHFTYLIV